MTRAGGAVAAVAVMLLPAALKGCTTSAHAVSYVVQGVSPAVGPCLFWPHAADETAAQLKTAGIRRICVPPDRAESWKGSGVEITAVQLGARERLQAPGIGAKPRLLSATRAPWVDANGWRFIRRPAGAFAYELPAGKGALAAAEASAYGADALIRIEPKDLPDVGRMLAFFAQVPPAALPAVADFGFVDDGSDIAAEVMKLLVRRNLLFEVVKAPASRFNVNVVLGAPGYSREEALDNPSEFAQKVRAQLTDARRSLRVYGTEVVVGRLTADARRARLHLLNYGERELEGLRIRVRGRYREGSQRVPEGTSKLNDYAVVEDATEFSIPRLATCAVIDLTAAK